MRGARFVLCFAVFCLTVPTHARAGWSLGSTGIPGDNTDRCTTVEVPVGAMVPDGRVVSGLKREYLLAEVQKQQLPVTSLSYDEGPRRVLFVLDTESRLPKGALKAEAYVISQIVAQARKEDSFALQTARGVLRQVKFGEARERLVGAANDIAADAKEPKSTQSILDAMNEALDWFQKPLPGDAIILMSTDDNHASKISYSALSRAISLHQIRLFGFLLSPILAGYYDTQITNTGGRLGMHSTVMRNPESIYELMWNHGGYVTMENAQDPWKRYQVDDARLKQLQREASAMYDAIVELYRIRLQAPTERHEQAWKLDVIDELRKKVPTLQLLYPRTLPACEISDSSSMAQGAPQN